MSRIVTFSSDSTRSDVVHTYDEVYRQPSSAIIIDNGSYECRAGWSLDDEPRLKFKNVGVKIKSKKTQETEFLVGNSIGNIEAVRWQLKSAFERNLVTQFDIQENVLDYIFSHLSIDTQNSVDHPLVVTEAVLNPAYCREKMSELLFECYNVPSVLYGIDSLFSRLYNQSTTTDTAFLPPQQATSGSVPPHISNTVSLPPQLSDGLIISCGYQTIHILPVLEGRLVHSRCRRINFGGATVDSFMLKTLQLKYPGHISSLTLSAAEELVQKYCHVAVDFESELLQWMNDEYYNNSVVKVQLPYTQVAAAVVTAEQQRDRREQQLQRLHNMNIKRRQEKLAVEEAKLIGLQSALQLIQEESWGDDTEEFDSELRTRVLMDYGMSSIEELNKAIENLTSSVQQLRDKLQNSSTNTVSTSVEEDLRDPDKRARVNKLEPMAKKPKPDNNKLDVGAIPNENNPTAMKNWIENLQLKKQTIQTNQIKRRQRRADMTKRRTVASHDRMRILSQLSQGNSKKDDGFGMNDDDWNVYKYISRDGGETDSEDEMEELELINYYLNNYDPASKTKNTEEQEKASDREFDIAEYYRLHIALEQIRMPELLFQPSMMGLDQAGLSETIAFILEKFSPEEQSRLVQNIFLTGGCANFPNLIERLEKELRAVRPFQTTFHISRAQDLTLDSWRGARLVAQTPLLQEFSVSRWEYEEKGGSFIKENCTSNPYV